MAEKNDNVMLEPRPAFVMGLLIWELIVLMHSFDMALNFSFTHFLKLAPLGIVFGLFYVAAASIVARFMKWRDDRYAREIEERMRKT